MQMSFNKLKMLSCPMRTDDARDRADFNPLECCSASALIMQLTSFQEAVVLHGGDNLSICKYFNSQAVC